MQLSKLKLNKNIEKQVFAVFYQTVADLDTSEEAATFLNDFLTKIELTTLAKRLMVAIYLEQGHSYESIKANLRVSSATIAHIDKMMVKHSQGFTLALKKIEAEQWADNLTQKITSFVSNFTGK
jgi:TrpR-related protein YerC/YecD